MSWGSFAAMSLSNHYQGLGKKPKHWKVLGYSSAQGMTEHKAQKAALKAEYSSTKTEADMAAHISLLQSQISAADTPMARASFKMNLKAAKSAQKSLLASGGFFSPSATRNVPDPIVIGNGTDPVDVPTDQLPTDGGSGTSPGIGDVINGGNGGTSPNVGDTYIGVHTGEGRTSLLAPASGSPTGMTMWDTIQDVTSGSKTMLIAGAGIIAYFLFFRRRR